MLQNTPLAQFTRNHAMRVVEFLVGLAGLWLLYLLDHDLSNGVIEVPPAWQPYLPLALGLTSVLLAGLTPQVIKLRAGAFSLDPSDPVLAGLSAQIADAVASALNSAPLPSTTPAATTTTPTNPQVTVVQSGGGAEPVRTDVTLTTPSPANVPVGEAVPLASVPPTCTS